MPLESLVDALQVEARWGTPLIVLAAAIWPRQSAWPFRVLTALSFAAAHLLLCGVAHANILVLDPVFWVAAPDVLIGVLSAVAFAMPGVAALVCGRSRRGVGPSVLPLLLASVCFFSLGALGIQHAFMLGERDLAVRSRMPDPSLPPGSLDHLDTRAPEANPR